VSIGGGALITGVAKALKSLKPEVRIIGVETRGADAMALSLAANQLVELPAITSIARTLGAPKVCDFTLSHVRELVEEVKVLTAARVAPAQADFTELNARADKLFAAYDKQDSPGCALAVIKDGAVIHKRGYGRANLEADAPIAPGTIFHIASVSKQFTSFAV